MAWPGLERRFARWFADAVAEDELDLAIRIARVTALIAHAETWGRASLIVFLDELEAAEPEASSSSSRRLDIPQLRALVQDLEALLDEARGPDANSEAPLPYVVF